jgi:hypothetical protein
MNKPNPALQGNSRRAELLIVDDMILARGNSESMRGTLALEHKASSSLFLKFGFPRLQRGKPNFKKER